MLTDSPQADRPPISRACLSSTWSGGALTRRHTGFVGAGFNELVFFLHAGAESPLLANVDLALPPHSLGLVYGRSGAGKTTLLQLLAGLQQPTAGRITISAGGVGPGVGPGRVLGGGEGQSTAERLARVGLVFQFPERHFLGDTLQQARDMTSYSICISVTMSYGLVIPYLNTLAALWSSHAVLGRRG